MQAISDAVPGRLDALADLLDQGPPTRILCEHRGTPVTLERLRQSRDACVDSMEKAGVGAGDTVVAILGTKPNAVAAMFAAWRLRAAFAPLDPHLSPFLARRFLDAVAPSVVLAGDEPAPVLPDGAGVVQPAGDDHLDWDVDSSASAGIPRRRVTALPKEETALRLAFIDVAGNVLALTVPATPVGAAASALPEDLGTDCRVSTFSFDSWAGIVELLAAVRCGHRLVLCSPFSSTDFRRAVKRHGPKVAALTTQMMAMLVEDPDAEDLGPLREVRFASSHLPIPLVRRFHRQFGVGVVSGFGNRAFGSEVIGWTATDVGRFGSKKVGSVGRPLPGVGVSLVDDSGEAMPEGRVGELEITPRGGKPTRTGRHAWLDPDGFVWIVGRSGDMVDVDSRQVFPESVEAVLVEHDDVRDVAVFGVPGPDGSNLLWAVLRPAARAGGDPEALVKRVLESARGRLTRPELPGRVAVLDVLPKTEAGLPDRDALAAQALAGALPAMSVTP